MSEFNPSNKSKPSDGPDLASEEIENREEEFKTVRDLLRQLNQSNGSKSSTDRLVQQSTLQDLLDCDLDRQDPQEQAQLVLRLSYEQSNDDPLDPDASQNLQLDEDLPSTLRAETLDTLAQKVCDRISPHLTLHLERNGFHQCTRIFSQRMLENHRIYSTQADSSPSSAAVVQFDALERLTAEIEHLLHHRLVRERERLGRSTGRLP
jgi:hypothetical protein